MATLKTVKNDASVTAFLNKVPDEQKRADCFTLVEIMQAVTRKPAVMWGTAIVGFDKYDYKLASGKMGEMCLVGFSPRAQNITLYVGASGIDPEILAKLGKYKVSGSCLHIVRLSDVHLPSLKALIRDFVKKKRAAQ